MRLLANSALTLARASADIWVTTTLFPATLGDNQQPTTRGVARGHTDRGELHPLAPGGSPKQTDLIQDLARRVALKVMLRNAICPDNERGSIELSEDELDALRAIGYGN